MSQTAQGETLKDAAIGVALTSLLFAISLWMPVFGLFCPLFVPLPVLFYRSKLGRQGGAVVLALSFVAMALLSKKISGNVLVFAELMLIGFFLGEVMEMNLPVERTVLFTCGSAMLAGMVLLILFGNISDIGTRSLTENLTGSIDGLKADLYENRAEISDENLRQMTELLDNLRQKTEQQVPLLPGWAIASLLFVTWTTLLMAKPMLKSRGLFYPDFGALRLWRVPEFLVWGVIGCGMMLFFPDRGVNIAALNGLIALSTVYFFGGIAVVSFFFEKKGFSTPLRYFLYALVALQVFRIFVIGLGFFDMWMNFRKLKTEN